MTPEPKIVAICYAASFERDASAHVGARPRPGPDSPGGEMDGARISHIAIVRGLPTKTLAVRPQQELTGIWPECRVHAVAVVKGVAVRGD